MPWLLVCSLDEVLGIHPCNALGRISLFIQPVLQRNIDPFPKKTIPEKWGIPGLRG